MRNLQEATERICELKGNVSALDALVTALLQQMNAQTRTQLIGSFSVTAEVARTMMLHAPVSDITLAAFDRDIARMTSIIAPAAAA
jgi:hypothetical protein